MCDQDLLNLGFKEFSPSSFDSNDIEICFQKRYDNEIGKKYFITIKKWKAWKHSYTGELIPPAYEYDTQLYKKDGHDAINLLFHSSWELEDVEKYLEAMWKTGLFDYYEKFFEE